VDDDAVLPGRWTIQDAEEIELVACTTEYGKS
jgi:hypothetical protein